ncbi:hypothetical protein [Streptomyces anulatus]|uniref:hypothetical protein n=1 Tax=Streptomyces anulatus TaxID=1892 RepID=UPI002E12AC8E|nr:hypothetical protein OG274_20415 [Streptomyces anulatus]
MAPDIRLLEGDIGTTPPHDRALHLPGTPSPPLFIGDWEVLLTLRTTEFTERPHVGQLHDHTHRMGLLLAARTSTLTDHL